MQPSRTSGSAFSFPAFLQSVDLLYVIGDSRNFVFSGHSVWGIGMKTREELAAELADLAARSAQIRGFCRNEESTKLHLVLPLISMLGYDAANPSEVSPEHDADFDIRHPNRVDFAILRDGSPIIAIECKKVGTNLADVRGQLRSYYSALPTTALAILANGIQFEFFVDSSDPNLMDEEPFLTLDLEVVAHGKLSEDVIDALMHVTKAAFDPETIRELAHAALIRKRLRASLIAEANAPSEDFCRCLLQRSGLKNVRKSSIERHYAPMIRAAFSEALIMPLVRQLRDSLPAGSTAVQVPHDLAQRIVTTERELAVFAYVRRRLAFLVCEEWQFNAIEDVEYKDYIGKLVVYYGKERKGRLFDYVEGADGLDKFVFPEPHGEIVTNNLLDIDAALKAMFSQRVQEMGAMPQLASLARIA
jgi:hypothetical protein